jgi:hypothetical protein
MEHLTCPSLTDNIYNHEHDFAEFKANENILFNTGKRSRDTQTAEWKEQQQNTTYDVATQMYKADHYVPCPGDRILEAKRCIQADESEKHADLNTKVGTIQITSLE